MCGLTHWWEPQSKHHKQMEAVLEEEHGHGQWMAPSQVACGSPQSIQSGRKPLPETGFKNLP